MVSEGSARRVTRMTGTDTYTPIAETWRDGRFNRPADVAAHSDGSVYFTDPGGVPDGLSVDAEGRVYYAGRGRVWVFDAAGEHLGAIEVPEPPTGCAWGGSDLKTMYVTAGTSVYSLKMKTAGAR